MDKWLIRKGQPIKRQKKKSEDDCREIPLVNTAESTKGPETSCVPKNYAQIFQHKVRLYNSAYLSFGFLYTGNESEPKALCVVGHEKLSNNSKKLSLLKTHINTKHESLKPNHLSFLRERNPT